MAGLENTIQEFLKKHQLSRDSSNALLACSGGIDSIVLGQVMVKLGFSFAIAHCNFQLRGEDADGDEQFVRHFAKQHNLPFHSIKFDTSLYANSHKISTQMAARELRYTYFEQLQNEEEFDAILIGHHLDDSLETILINLSRSTGILGLGGIPKQRDFLLRPMHEITREEISMYAKENQIIWREDCSNEKENYQRNFIRHQVSTSLKRSHPYFESGFKKSLEFINKDLELFNFQLQEIAAKIVVTENESLKISIPKLLHYPSTSSILNFILKDFGKFDLVGIENSLTTQSGKTFYSLSHTLLRDRENLLLFPTESTSELTSYKIERDTTELTHPLELEIQHDSVHPNQFAKANTLGAFDFELLQFPLEIRRWKSGDSFVPLGMSGTKKLSDYFIDSKLSALEKSRVWLLCSGSAIIWIIGHQINDHYKVTNTTKTAYFVRLIS